MRALNALFKLNVINIFIIFLIIQQPVFAAAPNSETIDFLQIKKHASLANATYQSNPKIPDIAQLANYKITHHEKINEFEVSFFVATNDIDKSHIIAVRGTSNIENVFIDVAFKLIKDNNTGAYLHNGFSQTANSIYKKIRPYIEPGYKISTTGHSMGGAVALIIAMRLDIDQHYIKQVVTFGQPKVTNITGALNFKHLNLLRIVTPGDLVPLVPPFDPLDLNDLDIYWHMGEEIILKEGKDYSTIDGIESMLRATKFTQEALSERNIIHHNMSLYLNMINKKIPEANRVPYKNDYNIFNWFNAN